METVRKHLHKPDGTLSHLPRCLGHIFQSHVPAPARTPDTRSLSYWEREPEGETADFGPTFVGRQ